MQYNNLFQINNEWWLWVGGANLVIHTNEIILVY